MQTISASRTFFFKRVFPAIWFGFLALFFVTSLGSGAVAQSPMFIAMPVIMAIFGFFVMRHLVFDLVDEVLDAGDHLVVRNGGREIVVRIVDIINVSTALTQNPPRVTLRLATPSELGLDIAFMVKRDFSWNPFNRSCAIADDLMRRVDAARRTLPPGVSGDRSA